MVRFDQWMQQALHHPDYGYYARKINTVGASGDFSTTATLSPILGKAIAASFLETKGITHLIEIGAGDGSLARSVLSALPFFKRLRIHYHIVDTSLPLSENQKSNLGKLAKKVRWHRDIKDALRAANGKAYIFSNELVDAFPVRIFKHSNKQLLELHLDGVSEHFIEANAPEPFSSALNEITHPENYRVEFHQSYYEWLHDWLPHWQEGKMITIDYGDTYPEIYHRLPQGTLRAYAHHQRITGSAVYQNRGHQDITADVNFTDLIHWGEDFGLKTVKYLTQAEFLLPYSSNNHHADQFLIDQHGAGSAFKVLIQEKVSD